MQLKFSDAEKVALISPSSDDDIIEYIALWSINALLFSVLNPFYFHYKSTYDFLITTPVYCFSNRHALRFRVFSDVDKVTLFFTMMTLLSILHFGLLLLCLFSAVVCLFISTNQLHK